MQNSKPQLKIKNFNFLLLLLTFEFCLLNLPLAVNAASASLYLSPSSGNYTVGNTFSVTLKVNSGQESINAAEATLVFDPDKLEAVSVFNDDSIFNLWVQNPTISNSAGTVVMSGGKPSPGFTGSSGTIYTVVFKAKTSGIANITFASGSVLADDGLGTNILSNYGSGSYKFIAREVTPIIPAQPVTVSQPTSGVPLAPAVSSLTHADEEKWYSNSFPEFTWKLSSDIAAVSLLLHEKPTANPGSESDGLLTSKKYENVEDGIWYFHIKFRNQYGWGEITHRRVLIDTKAPDPFEVNFYNGGDFTDPRPILLFQTEDSLSGVEYYRVEFSSQTATTSPADIEGNPFQPQPLEPGRHQVEVKAFDRAGNFSLAQTKFEILPIEKPKIEKMTSDIKVGDIFSLEGQGIPGAMVRVYIQNGEEEPILERTDVGSNGRFSFKYDKVLAKGEYLVWLRSEDKRGALSYPTKKQNLAVGLPAFLRFGKIAIDYLSVMITLIVIIIGALFAAFYAWYKVSLWRKRLRGETKEVAQSVSAAFKALRDEVEEQVSLLDKKPGLTKKEKEVRDKLKEALDVSERFIGKEIKDVEKELE